MTNISAADKAKQDAARENDGKFGHQPHGEPEGGTNVLTVPADTVSVDSVPPEAFIPQDRKQHTAMVMAIEDMPENVRSFRLLKDEYDILRAEDIKDAEGRPVSEHVATEVEDIFFDTDEGDLSEYIDKTVDVQETLVSWR